MLSDGLNKLMRKVKHIKIMCLMGQYLSYSSLHWFPTNQIWSFFLCNFPSMQSLPLPMIPRLLWVLKCPQLTLPDFGLWPLLNLLSCLHSTFPGHLNKTGHNYPLLDKHISPSFAIQRPLQPNLRLLLKNILILPSKLYVHLVISINSFSNPSPPRQLTNF